MTPATAARRWMPSGDRGTIATLREMANQVNRAIYSPAVVETAVGAVRYVNGRDTVGLASALRAWLVEHISFLPDPLVHGDVLREPDYVAAEINKHGIARIDCDDAAMFSAALAKSVGLPARFVVLGFPIFKHVYSECLTKDGWFELDVTEDDLRRRTAMRAVKRVYTFTV